MSGRIVLVDDSADDRFLLAREVHRELPAAEIDEITSAAELARALDEPDVVACITDYLLRWTDGLTVLRTFKARHPEAPVVMFTGSGGETVAVDAMKAGLDDYIIKSPSSYGAAARALRRAIEQAEHRRKRREAELRLKRLFQGVPVGLFVLSPAGRIIEANPAAARALGFEDSASMVDVDLEALLEDDDARSTLRAQLAVGEQVERTEARVRRRDGALIWASFTATPGTDGDGATTRYECVLEDVTERKRAEALLREQAEQLAEADRRKDEFLATLAHELRNPLAAITTAAHLLSSSRDPAEHERHRGAIERQAGRLGRMVDDLLDVARLARGTLTLRVEPVALDAVAAHAAEASRALIEQRQHRFSLERPEAPLWVDGDPVRVEQIVSNLVENAAKYTEPGGSIMLRLEAAGDRAVLRVKDTGVGIAPELLPRLFELFTQGERGLDRAQGGLGIGLAVVRQLVSLHGGTIEAHSAGIGRGSELVVRLPRRAAPAETAPRSQPPKSGSTSRRVLVVEDNDEVGELLVELLEDAGHAVWRAADGPSAFALYPEARPDVVLLDLGLPGMSGFDVARRLRAEGCRALLVALSGYGQDRDREATRAAGFDLHLTKPISLAALEDLLAGNGAP